MISVILPTYNESENIPLIIPKISEVLSQEGVDFEIIVVDDNSPDGTANEALSLGDNYPVRVSVRKKDKGLSSAVVHGFGLAKGEVVVVMDADLSHPMESLPEMIRPILEGKCDATVGSRCVAGGGSEKWPLVRRLVSKGAGLLAKGLTSLSDPTSGFMAVRRGILEGVKLDPIGWKIVLETIVKTKARVLEIPIVFRDRQRGESKLDLRVQKDYFRHLSRLYAYKYPTFFQFAKFCLTGLSGLIVDTAILVLFVESLSFDPRLAAIFAFLSAVSWNYVINRLWTFKRVKVYRNVFSFMAFFVICVVGLSIRLGVMHLLIAYAGMGRRPLYVLASIFGILLATSFNFLGSKYFAFSKMFEGRTGRVPSKERASVRMDPRSYPSQ